MRKSYSKFTITEIYETFGVQVIAAPGLFADEAEWKVNDFLVEQILDNLPLAHAIGTEKAKSEMLVAPILTELRRIKKKEISLFSGVEFNVDAKQGLKGVCDFLVSRSPLQYMIHAPVIVLVEAKDDSLDDGLPQCLAEMIAARLFNQARNNSINTIYGSVTRGSDWNFIKLENNTALVDSKEYSIENPHKIMGILLSMLA